MIIVNCKSYEEGTGDKAVSLAQVCAAVSKETNVPVVLAVQAVDIFRARADSDATIFAQTIDDADAGAHTGSVTTHAITSAGASGSLLNHAECQKAHDDIAACHARLQGSNLSSVIIAKAVDELSSFVSSGLSPDYFSVEPPELIGGDVSVSSAQPDLIKDAVAASGDVPLLVGAGIKTGEDVRISLELGAAGILVASGVVKSDDARKVLMEFAQQFKK